MNKDLIIRVAVKVTSLEEKKDVVKTIRTYFGYDNQCSGKFGILAPHDGGVRSTFMLIYISQNKIGSPCISESITPNWSGVKTIISYDEFKTYQKVKQSHSGTIIALSQI